MPATLRRSPHILLEVAIGSADDARSAQDGGADRVELNSALWLGGLTPSLGTYLEARDRTTLPLVVMIRPRPGGFCYSGGEFSTMGRDLDLFLAHGARAFALGILRDDGEVDVERCRPLIERAGSSCEMVFHRAYDVTPDPEIALETLIDLGFRRVMTSGQEDSAYNGSDRIARSVAQSAGRIEVLPAGGINRFTLADVLARTGCDQVHASLKSARRDRSTAARAHVGFGGTWRLAEDRYEATDPAAVAALRERLDRP